ncbi:MAG: AI-2E family transporter [Hyphomicrobiaceae bacterium]|nr:AI-2E family transporter [Hyphomicrobiaceae bacterium]MCC0023583.1 AI-2E family transporter [Hyphomicrobiaceae bacterium]
MSLQKQFWIWIALFAFTILALWVFRGILLPFVVGMGLAYLLNPAVEWLDNHHFSRFWATSIVMVVVVVLVVGAFLLVVPLVVPQVISLGQLLPGYVSELQKLVNQWLPELHAYLGDEQFARFENSLSDLLRSGVSIAGNLTAQVMQSGLTMLNALGLLIVTPVVAFYLLLDWDKLTKTIDDLLPRAHREEIQSVLGDIDRAMAGVIRGQGSVVLLLAAFYGISLSLAQLNFGLAIGVAAGLLSFVPYIGFLVGFVLSVGVALVQFWPDGLMVGLIVGIFLVGQFLEGNVLYPKFVGSSIGVHPVWLMFSLFAVGILFGFVGLLLAVPFVAIAGVLVRFAIRKYREGPLYKDGEDVPELVDMISETGPDDSAEQSS